MSALFPLTVRGAATRRRGRRLVGPVDMELDGSNRICVPQASKMTFAKMRPPAMHKPGEPRYRWRESGVLGPLALICVLAGRLTAIGAKNRLQR